MPIILYTLMIASLIPILLAGMGGYCRVRQFGTMDNHHPRQQQALLTGIGARVQASQANAWEALTVYATVTFIAFAAGVDLHSLSTAAVLFILMRVLHAVCYVANLATLRSLVFVVAMGCCVYILIRAIGV